jgi:hypothetical protein
VTTSDTVIAAYGRQTVRAFHISHVAATLCCFVVLLAPALWNRYPLLQYDTGGYLARWYEDYLVPSRSTVFGLFLHLGEGLHFWPELVLQTACAIWVMSLVLGAAGFAVGSWHRTLMVAGLALVTALPVLSSTLLTDIFAGLSVLSLHLLIFHRSILAPIERIGLFLLIAFAAATHSATLIVLLAVLVLAVPILLVLSLRPAGALLAGVGAIATGAAMLLAGNLALLGQLAWTPGGFGIAFGRMLQDGIVKRYLDDHCPIVRLRLCPYRNELPATADDFLRSNGVFNELGRFRGLDEEMRFIVLHSLREYPLQQIETALAASARQLRLVATGHGTHDQIWHTYGIIERYIPGEVPAMRNARQQRGELNFDPINRVHVPIALGSMILALVLLARATISGRFDETGEACRDRYGRDPCQCVRVRGAVGTPRPLWSADRLDRDLHGRDCDPARDQQFAAQRKRPRRLAQARAFAPARRDRTTCGCASPANSAGHALHESSMKAHAPKIAGGSGGIDVGAAPMTQCRRERKSPAAAGEGTRNYELQRGAR